MWDQRLFSKQALDGIWFKVRDVLNVYMFYELVKCVLYLFLIMSSIVENGINIADDSEASNTILYYQPLALAHRLFFLPIRSKADWLDFHSVSLSLYSLWY